MFYGAATMCASYQARGGEWYFRFLEYITCRLDIQISPRWPGHRWRGPPPTSPASSAARCIAQATQRRHVHAGVARLMDVRFVHLRRARAERSVDEPLHAAEPHPVVARNRVLGTELGQLPPLASGRGAGRCEQVNRPGGRQLAGRRGTATGVGGGVAAVHVLHAGDALTRRLGQGGTDGLRRSPRSADAGISGVTRSMALSRSRPVGSRPPGLR